jgi:hypothetical protein
MALSVKAWQLRESARGAVGAGEFEEALDWVLEAQEIQRTGAGESLRVLCEGLADGGDLRRQADAQRQDRDGAQREAPVPGEDPHAAADVLEGVFESHAASDTSFWRKFTIMAVGAIVILGIYGLSDRWNRAKTG